ncbi:hypothetical protein [Paenibacillus sp. L3-i20]|uniref:hypothetical protein n=1 Tax=Paenibacillus sp. L3-i20 TaxID=2905833 RepID=UPI001EE0873B|nr:hypothetical protein [Paenibacillus sp. L3-i20]GKU78916.1 hypothetical protein L3i20_v233130 [Paenibacillus sp. L3-i20]
MISTNGVFRLVYEDASWYFGKQMLLFITIPLTFVWIILGFLFELDHKTIAAISGPAYFFVAGFGLFGFKPLFALSIAMGSTRIQFLKKYLSVSVAAVTLSILCLNVCQFALVMIYKWNNVEAKILHPASLLLNEYQFFPYLWVDLMVGIALFGFTFLFYAIFYRVGFTRSLITLMIVTIAGLFLYYGNILTTIFNWLWNIEMNALANATILGLLSLGALFATYPMLRNAPLHPKPKR